MSSPVVLITGALTGIGRAAAVIFAQEGARVVVSGRRDKQGRELVRDCKRSERRPFLFVLMSARKRTCATLWMKRSSVSAAWMRPSTTPAQKARPALFRNKPPKASR